MLLMESGVLHVNIIHDNILQFTYGDLLIVI